MKLLLTFALVAVYVASVQSLAIDPEIKEKILQMKKECLAEVPDINPDIIAKLKKQEFVEDPELKKFFFCIQKKTHCQTEDGTFVVPAIKAKVCRWVGSNDHDADVEECTKKDLHDGPENAFALLTCLKSKLPILELE